MTDEKDDTKTNSKSLKLFIFENFSSPIFLHLYKIECKVNDKLKKNNFDNITEHAKGMLYINELTRNNAKTMLQLLANYNICENCILPKDLIREILEYGYDINNDLKLFDGEFEIPILDRIKIIPLLFAYIECIINIILITCSWYQYYYYLNIFGSIQYIITTIHLILCHLSFFVNASLPNNLLEKWDLYYSIYKHGHENNQNTNNHLKDRNKLLLLPYVKWGNINELSINVPNCLPNDYIWIFAKCYNYYIYKLIMYHNISLCFTNISHKNMYFRQWYAFGLYVLPILYVGIKAVIVKYLYFNPINFGRYLLLIMGIIISYYYDHDNEPLPVIILNSVWKLFGLHFYNYLVFNHLVEHARIKDTSIFKFILTCIYPFGLFIAQFWVTHDRYIKDILW